MSVSNIVPIPGRPVVPPPATPAHVGQERAHAAGPTLRPAQHETYKSPEDRAVEALARRLQISVQTIAHLRATGLSLAQIAAAHGVSRSEAIAVAAGAVTGQGGVDASDALAFSESLVDQGRRTKSDDAEASTDILVNRLAAKFRGEQLPDVPVGDSVTADGDETPPVPVAGPPVGDSVTVDGDETPPVPVAGPPFGVRAEQPLTPEAARYAETSGTLPGPTTERIL